jgi:hypothetical protein
MVGLSSLGAPRVTTQEAALADLREGLELLIEEVGPPDEMTLTLDVA